MSSKKDLLSIGEAYGDVLNRVKINEEVPAGEIGEAPLESGGPEERGGFRPSEIDIDRMSEKDKKDNIYNIKGYTYGDGNDPGNTDQPDPTGPTYAQAAYTGVVGPEEDEEGGFEGQPELTSKAKARREFRERFPQRYGPQFNFDEETGTWTATSGGKVIYRSDTGSGAEESEEDEEILGEHEKMARDGLNNFMSKQSVFDKLYDKVMVSENFPNDFGDESQEDVNDLEALGIETEVDVDEVPEEIALTIPGELAQTLADILQTALAQQETDVDIDVDVTETDTDFEEDEEAAMKDGGGYSVDAGSTLKKEINYGKKNKVGKLHAAGGAVQKDGGGYGVDAGSPLSKEVNYGKQNKVGTTKLGSIPGA